MNTTNSDTEQLVRDLAREFERDVLGTLWALPSTSAEVRRKILTAVHVHLTKASAFFPQETVGLICGGDDAPNQATYQAVHEWATNRTVSLGEDFTIDGIETHQHDRLAQLQARLKLLRRYRLRWFTGRAARRADWAAHLRDVLNLFDDLPVATDYFDAVFYKVVRAGGFTYSRDGYMLLDAANKPVGDPFTPDFLGAKYAPEALEAMSATNLQALHTRWTEILAWAYDGTRTEGGDIESDFGLPSDERLVDRFREANRRKREADAKEKTEREEAARVQNEKQRQDRGRNRTEREARDRQAAAEEFRRHLKHVRTHGLNTNEADDDQRKDVNGLEL